MPNESLAASTQKPREKQTKYLRRAFYGLTTVCALSDQVIAATLLLPITYQTRNIGAAAITGVSVGGENMGITKGAIRLLAMAYDGLQVSGDVITFGVQAVEATAAQAKMILNIGTSNQLAERGSEAPIHQGTLFKLLGFASVSSIDFYPAESPSYVMDLNLPLPSDLYGRFNLVYDGGTSEHCFCTSEVLSNAVRLTKLGGRVMHHVPLNNWVDHGFYQFSPTLLFDFYEANGFDELNMLLHFIDRRRERYLPYEPRHFGRLPYSFGGKTKVQGFFTARRAKLVEDIVFPIQGRYRRAFGGEKENRHSPETRWSRLARSIGKRTFRLRAKPL